MVIYVIIGWIILSVVVGTVAQNMGREFSEYFIVLHVEKHMEALANIQNIVRFVI